MGLRWLFLGLRWPTLAVMGLRWPSLAVVALRWPSLAVVGLGCRRPALSVVVNLTDVKNFSVNKIKRKTYLPLKDLMLVDVAVMDLRWHSLASSGCRGPLLAFVG